MAAEAGAAVKSGAVAMPVGGEVAAPAAPAAPVAQSFTISRSDKTIREALVTWSRRAGWTHDTEHWTVPFDLPVLSSADLGTDFKGAVRALLASTDLTNMPLQPCFYSNKVLRVVPKAELCDRMAN
ncbi:TcpQ domain-containing protein [Variovorax ginsengisoli]|uniref:TcpQ domain-containing protein n=1 Tax=Variovorax ginsengisoli TaxID=363844 RepID=A0ABT8SDZ3_9BURK|nr:TcpQ domain-containing protein [Variovorax ginsengisoli]MDN8616501.1 TcpQ domain-containing protein [Variovorax ginsengisoli]MDO1535671.1 TcpQ domain-containing protein [Variovorax ginsengisoli]